MREVDRRTRRYLLIVTVAALFASSSPLRAQLFQMQAQAQAVPPEHRATLDRLNAVTMLPLAAWRLHPADVAHGEAVDLDDSSWPQAADRVDWKGSASWFRQSLQVPQTIGGYNIEGSTLRLDIHSDGQMIVYVSGSRVAMGEDLEPVELTRHATPGERVPIAVKVFDEPGNHTFRASVEVVPDSKRPDPHLLSQELESADRIVGALAVGQERATREGQIEGAYRAVRLEALDRSDSNAFDRSLRDAQRVLSPLSDFLHRFSIRATGNSHIDMAWLWPSSETVDVVHRTFDTALQLMNEYPQYTFTQSSAQTDAWLEEKYPATFEEIRRRVREGRWELVGGMWVEPDLNMPDGESIVRQLLTGKRYFREKFGVDVRVGWNPDSFGYNWQLPQIYKKSGIDFFVTQKLYWNDTTKFPHKLFWWESPDGSRVLTYFPHDYVNSLEPVRMAGDVADYVPAQKGYPEILHLYGIGDHGGGPTRFMFDRGQKWRTDDVVYPKLFFGTAEGFFEALEKKAPALDLPVWKSELYLEYHRGVFTTQAATKRNNRRSEELLLTAEKFSSMASLFGHPYPAADLDFAWKKVLFNQFHDVAAGSGISAIYRDADRDYAEVRRIGSEALEGAVAELTSHVDTRGEGIALLVFNPLGWARGGIVEAQVQLPAGGSGVEVRDAAGKLVPSEVLEKLSANRYRILFAVADVPSVGYKLFRALPGTARIRSSDLSASGTTIENTFLRVAVDPNSGCIVSLFDKHARREALAPGSCGNRLQAFRDKPKNWDAWNIDANFEDQTWEVGPAQSVRLIEKGPLRAVLRVARMFQGSAFSQDLTLYSGVPRLEVVTDADWHEKHVLVKAAIELPVHSDWATFEIPYGTIQRPTTRRTPQEKAQFEVPALRWADLSDGDFGVSLLNDCKYGYDARDNVLRLSLLRSPEWPDPHADEGRHHFTYAIYPHAGDWKRGATMRQGYELNVKLQAFAVAPHVGTLPPEMSLVRIEPASVALTAVKKADAGDSLVLRFYEFEGTAGQATLTFPRSVARASETNLMEVETRPLVGRGNRLTVPYGPYEIKTVSVAFAPDQKKESVPNAKPR